MAEAIQQVSSAEKALLAQSMPFMALSRNVYDTGTHRAPDGWKIIAPTESPKGRVDGFFARLYQRVDESGQPHYAVAFRGSDGISDLKNLGADVKIALLRVPGQYRKGLKFVLEACRERNIDPASVNFTGHSLGGYLAATIGSVLGSNNIWTFDAPTPNAMTWRNIERRRAAKGNMAPGLGWVQIRATRDLIGRWGYYKKARTITIDTADSPHGLDSLQTATCRIVTGAPPAAAPARRRAIRGALTCIFNPVARLSEKLAVSRTINLAISFIMAVSPADHVPRVGMLLGSKMFRSARVFSPRPT